MNDLVQASPAAEIAPRGLVEQRFQKALLEAEKRIALIHSYQRHHGDLLDSVVRSLPGDPEDYNLSAGPHNFEIRFAGTREQLGQVVGVLRKAGFEPSNRPGKKDTSWWCYWDHPSKAQIWFGFTSTQCEKIKVGVEMVEQAVFEIHCGDTLEGITDEQV